MVLDVQQVYYAWPGEAQGKNPDHNLRKLHHEDLFDSDGEIFQYVGEDEPSKELIGMVKWKLADFKKVQ